MEPKVNNNPNPQPADQGPVGDIPAGDNSIIAFPNGLDEIAISKYCQTRNKVFDAWAKPLFERVSESHYAVRNKGSKQEKVTFPLPIMAGIIESINARLQSLLLGKPKVVEALAEQVETDNLKRERVEEFVNQQVMEATRRPDKGKVAIKSNIMDSAIFWRNLWKQDLVEYNQPKMVPDPAYPNMPGMPPGPMINAGDETVSKTKEYWTWEFKPMDTMAWDPNTITRVQDSPWVRERNRMSYNQMLRWQQEGRISGVERLRNILPSGVEGVGRENWAAMIAKADGDPYWPVTYADERAYKVEEWFADITWQQGQDVQSGKFHWFIVEDKVVINFEDNPLLPKRHPYGSCPFILRPGFITGLSVMDAVGSLQKLINNFAGYQADLGERAAKPLIFYDSSSGMSGRTSFFKMYGMQPVTNVNGIKEFTSSAEPIKIVTDYIDKLASIAREASGANEQFQGMEGADTATEFQGLQAAAGSRFADVADTMMQGWLEPLACECYYFYRQFGVDGQMFVREGTEGLTTALTRADLMGDYTFQAAGGMNGQQKQAEIQSAETALKIVSSLPPSPDGMVFNSQKAVKEIILPNLGQKTGGDWFIPGPPPMMPMPGGPPMQAQGGPPMEMQGGNPQP